MRGKSDRSNVESLDPPEERRNYLKTVGALVAGLAIGGAAAWLGKPVERITETVPGTTETVPGATETVPGPTITEKLTETATTTVTRTETPLPPGPRFEGEKVTLVTWGGWLIGSLIQEGVKQPLMLEFEKETGITLEVEILEETVAREKMMIDMTSHTGAYDVVCTSFYDVPAWASAGYLLDIDDLIEEYANPKYYSPTDYFLPSLDSCKYKEKLYSLPMYEHCGGFTYRKDIFDEKGLVPPTNFEELTELCKELNDPPDMYAISMRGHRGPIASGPCSGFAWAYGGHWFEHNANTEDEIKTLKAKPTFNSPEFKDGADKYVELLMNYGPPGSSTYNWYEVMRDFCAGKVAIALDADYGLWWALLNAEFDNPKERVAMALPPIGPGGEMFQWWWTFTHGINADSKHPEAAFQVLQLLSSVQLAEALVKDGVCGVPRISVMQSDEFAERFGKEAQRTWVALRGYAKPEFMPRTPQNEVLGTALGDAISDAIAGGKPIREGLEDVQAFALKVMTEAGYYG